MMDKKKIETNAFKTGEEYFFIIRATIPDPEKMSAQNNFSLSSVCKIMRISSSISPMSARLFPK